MEKPHVVFKPTDLQVAFHGLTHIPPGLNISISGIVFISEHACGMFNHTPYNCCDFSRNKYTDCNKGGNTLRNETEYLQKLRCNNMFVYTRDTVRIK